MCKPHQTAAQRWAASFLSILLILILILRHRLSSSLHACTLSFVILTSDTLRAVKTLHLLGLLHPAAGFTEAWAGDVCRQGTDERTVHVTSSVTSV